MYCGRARVDRPCMHACKSVALSICMHAARPFITHTHTHLSLVFSAREENPAKHIHAKRKNMLLKRYAVHACTVIDAIEHPGPAWGLAWKATTFFARSGGRSVDRPLCLLACFPAAVVTNTRSHRSVTPTYASSKNKSRSLPLTHARTHV